MRGSIFGLLLLLASPAFGFLSSSSSGGSSDINAIYRDNTQPPTDNIEWGGYSIRDLNTLDNAAFQPIIDIPNSTALRTDGSVSLDFENGRAKDPLGNTIFDWTLSKIYDIAGIESILTDARGLYDSFGIRTLGWGDMQLLDGSGVSAMLWGDRTLQSETGENIATWANDGLTMRDHASGSPDIKWEIDNDGNVGRPDGTSRPGGIYVGDAVMAGQNAGESGNFCVGDQTLGGTCVHGDGTQLRAKLQGVDDVWYLDIFGMHISGDLSIYAIGKGMQIAEGPDARMGKSTLVAGTVTVSNATITGSTRFFISNCLLSGVVTPTALAVSSVNIGSDFTILSSSALDTSDVCWELKEAI